MKKSLKVLIASMLFFSLMLLVQVTFADPPPPPASHGASGNQDPVGAPIDGGLGILLAMGAAYGGKKLYKARKDKKKAEIEEPVAEV